MLFWFFHMHNWDWLFLKVHRISMAILKIVLAFSTIWNTTLINFTCTQIITPTLLSIFLFKCRPFVCLKSPLRRIIIWVWSLLKGWWLIWCCIAIWIWSRARARTRSRSIRGSRNKARPASRARPRAWARTYM